jgi:hypothetical protein
MIAVPVVKPGPGKRNRYFRQGFRLKKSCCGGVIKGNEMK